MTLSSAVNKKALELLLWNPTKQTMGHNQPSSDYKNYFNLSESYPEIITNMFSEELQKELGECQLPRKHPDVKSPLSDIFIGDSYMHWSSAN
jgi:hypothetical protein